MIALSPQLDLTKANCILGIDFCEKFSMLYSMSDTITETDKLVRLKLPNELYNYVTKTADEVGTDPGSIIRRALKLDQIYSEAKQSKSKMLIQHQDGKWDMLVSGSAHTTRRK